MRIIGATPTDPGSVTKYLLSRKLGIEERLFSGLLRRAVFLPFLDTLVFCKCLSQCFKHIHCLLELSMILRYMLCLCIFFIEVISCARFLQLYYRRYIS